MGNTIVIADLDDVYPDDLTRDSGPAINAAIVGQARLQIDQVRRGQRCVGQFLFARPEHPDHGSGLLQGQQRGIECHVVSPIVAVAARAFGVVDGDLFLFERVGSGGQGTHHVVTQVVDALAVGPDFQLPTIVVRQSATQPYGRMRQIGLEVVARQGGVFFGEEISLLERDRDLVGCLPQEVSEVVNVGQGGRLCPANGLLQLYQGGIGGPVGVRHHAHESTIDHALNGRRRPGLKQVSRHGVHGVEQLCVGRRGAQYATVPHVG